LRSHVQCSGVGKVVALCLSGVSDRCALDLLSVVLHNRLCPPGRSRNILTLPDRLRLFEAGFRVPQRAINSQKTLPIVKHRMPEAVGRGAGQTSRHQSTAAARRPRSPPPIPLPLRRGLGCMCWDGRCRDRVHPSIVRWVYPTNHNSANPVPSIGDRNFRWKPDYQLSSLTRDPACKKGPLVQKPHYDGAHRTRCLCSYVCIRCQRVSAKEGIQGRSLKEARSRERVCPKVDCSTQSSVGALNQAGTS
jgi:hypothetical protein